MRQLKVKEQHKQMLIVCHISLLKFSNKKVLFLNNKTFFLVAIFIKENYVNLLVERLEANENQTML